MIKTKVAFVEDRLLSSQSEQFKELWLVGKKPTLYKSHFCFDHVNRQLENNFQRIQTATLFIKRVILVSPIF